MDSIALKVDGLTKMYKNFTLNNINLSVPMGTIMGFLGNNGAGKSTTLKSIMGLIQYDSGDIQLLDQQQSDIGSKIMHDIGYVGEEPNFYDQMTVKWYGNFSSKIYNVWDAEKYIKLCNAYNLDLNKKASELSRGMKVKLGLAIAFAHNPKLLILDEPTSGMDPASRRQLLAQLALFVSKGDRAVLFSSHIISDIEKAADSVTIIKDGEILLTQKKSELLKDGSQDLETIFLDLVGKIDIEELEVIV